MQRVAASRETVISQSNRFLIGGAAFGTLYAIKAVGLRVDIVLFDTRVFDVPYGLFVFCVLGTISFLIAQTRYMDAHALDRRLHKMAKSINPNQASFYYQTFPSEGFWLEATREQFFDLPDDRSSWSSFMLSSIGMVMLLVYFTPVISSVHYLMNWPSLAGENMGSFQWWIVAGTLAAAVLTFLFVQRVSAIKN